ncbi:hypothetical protein HYALB_00014059 [Hymenoscyphus albidus]|uniref:Uncharacterized protein n=1 Tax=Hymenoscyphus albidus TaxID=595503 RepID=A0A9N9LWU0_9HELO|nr:hypothetical protein HYALB_00014059 [Hymenoscyphus albidus]
MQFISTSLIAIMAAAITAAPTPNAQEASATAATQLIDLWVDKDFLGLKFTGSSTVNTCNNLSGGFRDSVSSGKAKAGFRCTVWVDNDCLGTGFSFNANPGSNLFPSWINDQSSSWKCVTA